MLLARDREETGPKGANQNRSDLLTEAESETRMKGIWLGQRLARGTEEFSDPPVAKRPRVEAVKKIRDLNSMPDGLGR
jgi:hypothetical protein